MLRGRMTHVLFIGFLEIVGITSFYLPLRISPLHGVFEQAATPTPTTRSWLSGAFQKEAERWIDEHIGFKAWFVKTDNQLNHWLFRENHQKTGSNIILGKNDHLYEQAYIDAWLGRDSVS